MINTPLVQFGGGGGAATLPGGSDTQVQFNDAGVFGGSALFTFNKTTGALTLAESGGATTAITQTTTDILFKPSANNAGLRVEDDGGADYIRMYFGSNGVIESSGGLNFSTAVGGGLIYIQSGGVAGVPQEMVDFTAGAHTNITTTFEQNDIKFNLSATKNWDAGNLTLQRDINISARTYTADGASVFTTAATLYINNAPTAGSNVTITNSYALYAAAGKSFFGGNVGIGDTMISGGPDKQLHIVSSTVSAGGTDAPGIYLETTDTSVFASNTIANINVLAGEAGGRGIVGQLIWKSNGTWTDSASPTDVFLSCTPSGALAIDATTTLVMKATGGLGWGTDNPRSKFHIVSTKNALTDLDDMNDYTIGLSNELDTLARSVSIGFSVDATFTTVGGAIVYERTGDNSKGIMHFYVKQDTGVGNPTEALSLEDDGQVILYGNTTIGAGVAGVDYFITFNGRFNDGVITWMDDEDYFDMADTVKFSRRVIRSKSVYTGTDTTDDVYTHICDSASPFTLTVTDGNDDGEEIVIMNRGAGTVTLSGKINTTTAMTTLLQGESVVLQWDLADDEWQ